MSKAQSIDSTSQKTLAAWVSKYNLPPALAKRITPLIVSQTKRQKVIDSLYPEGSARDTIGGKMRSAINDTINSILILNGYYNIESSRFINALKYSQRLNLSSAEITNLVAANLTLDRLKHTFVPTAQVESFDISQFTNANFPPIFNTAQYDTIVSIETTPQAIGDAKRLWVTVKKYGLGYTADSTKNFNAVVGYSLQRLLILKLNTNPASQNTAMVTLNANKPLILKQLDAIVNAEARQRIDSLELTNMTQQAIASWAKKYQLAPTLTHLITPLITQKTVQVFIIDTSSAASATKDSLRRVGNYAYDDRIDSALLTNGVNVTSNRLVDALNNRNRLQLASTQVTQLVNANTQLQQQRRATVTGVFDANTFVTQNLKTILATPQYDTVLSIESAPEAVSDAGKLWANVRKHGLGYTADSTTNFNAVVGYSLQRLLIIKLNNDTASQNAAIRVLNANKPLILQQLDAIVNAGAKQKGDSIALANMTRQAIASWTKKYQLAPALTQLITPLVTQKTAQAFMIDTASVASATKDSLRRASNYAYDDRIDSALLTNRIIIDNNRFVNALKYRDSLQLTTTQVTQLVNDNTQLQQLKRAFEASNPSGSFDGSTFTNTNFKPVFSASQYQQELRFEFQPHSVSDSQREWAALKKYNLTTNLDSVATFNILNPYNLDRLVAMRLSEESPNNAQLAAAAQAINKNKPAILVQLSIASKQSTAKPSTAGNYVW
jgi:predicted transcriptional regulator